MLDPPRMNQLIIRPATEADIPAITAIYGHSVANETASFEFDPPPEAEMARRMALIREGGFPYFICENNDRTVLGYAYAGAWRPRVGYNHTVEDSLYVAPDAQRQGVGRALLRALIAESEALGFRQMIAVIGDSRHVGSIELHRAGGVRDRRAAADARPQVRPLARFGPDAARPWTGREPAAGPADSLGFSPAQATTRRSGASRTRSTLARSWPRFRICPVAAISA